MKKISEKSIVALKELRENMEEYITRIDNGESFTVIKRSRPVFRLSPVDTEDDWETVVDFTEIHKQGVPSREVLSMLKELHGEA
jgi:antitoxin (DNA-binding transcriptional repressor) of toxin-antitoxin stability system